MLVDIREDLVGSATMIRHQKVPTPKVMITIVILPRMMIMMKMRERERRLIRFRLMMVFDFLKSISIDLFSPFF